VKAVNDGTLSVEVLDKAVRRILTVTLRAVEGLDPRATFDVAAHHALARRVATEAMVLLKNDGVLPLDSKKAVAFVGAFAKTPRYQGGGSSHMTPTRIDDAVTEAKSAGLNVTYAAGYALGGEVIDGALVAEAKAAAQKAQAAVVFLGMTDDFESEGFDRTHLGIPANHVNLLEEVLKVQKNVVVVLSNGSPIAMPWAPQVPAILEGYLGGQAWGGAVVDVLFGKSNPSGKLAETFPLRLEDNPSYLNFPGDLKKVEYREGIFVGYRHYDATHLGTLFPFGHGLSYTSFTYGAVALDKTSFTEAQTVTVKVPVTNSGKVTGAEVVQVYVADKQASVIRPVRELKGFAKVFLAPGETKTVSVTLDKRAFAFWSTLAKAWVVEAGEFELSVGSSSRDLRQSAVVTCTAGTPFARVWDQNTCLVELKDHPVGRQFMETHGRGFIEMFGAVEPGSTAELMMQAMVNELPLRNLVRMSGGKFSQDQLEGMLAQLNSK
jgi:beta-glucosidase